MVTQLSAVRAKVWLFHLKCSRRTRRSLSRNVTREICSYIQDTYIFASMAGSDMELYDFKTNKTTRIRLPTEVHSGYIQVDKTTVLVVGERVLTLDIPTLQITPLPRLGIPRNGIGVAQVENTVFAFGGGGNESMKVCEKSSAPFTQWTPLPSMHYARANFTPCPFKVLIYLASTFSSNHRAVESFSPHNETFTELRVSLPAPLNLASKSVTFQANGELILLTDKSQMARWKLGSGLHFFDVTTVDRPCYSYCPPFVVTIEVYIANALGPKVEKWNLKCKI